MYPGRQNLEPGRYRADSALVLAVYHNDQLMGLGEYYPGDEFSVPEHVNGYVSAVVWGTVGDTEADLVRFRPRWTHIRSFGIGR